ncbi:phage tail protein [Rhodococcus erythropolis]|uniref:phage tail protein n=1 Tax=Rhodococcus erythropolis TaxID=1833 RepID=UPI0024BBBF2D|nr:phage tail protein [Rhodococcus erythropolis]MDJ0404039.1 phage tail protein [Rhodococcus erythropolis]
MYDGNAKVEVFGVDKSYFCLAGPGQGDEGVYLSTNPTGFYDAPVSTIYKSSAFQIGSSYRGKRINQREMVFGVEVLGDSKEEWEDNDSRWRMAWDYEVDPWDVDATQTRMRITTDRSGSRDLWLRLLQQPDFSSDKDPRLTNHGRVPMTVIASEPMWFQRDVLSSWKLTAGTSGAGTVMMSNPTDQPMYAKWHVTAPGRWTLPDFSWIGPKRARRPGGKYPTRTVELPLLSAGEGGATVDLDPMKLMVRNVEGSNLIARMQGRYFMHKIPPYTPPTPVPVSVTGAVPGAGVILRMPRLWSRPWGLE